jgi:Mg-chelatase subunit ChlD
VLGLVRGYTDHEAAHIRDTDFAALAAANPTPLEKHIWNCLEDWRVENILASIYPGCGENFRWLIKHLFLPKTGEKKSTRREPAAYILDWLIVAIRSLSVPELLPERQRLRTRVEKCFPGLAREVEPILRTVPDRCNDTSDAVNIAREITGILQTYISSPRETPQDAQQQSGQALRALQDLLAAGEDELSGDLGSILRETVAKACGGQGVHLHVAVPTGKKMESLSRRELENARKATTALRTRLQAMMQSVRSVRNHCGYTGALDTGKLHALTLGSARVFLRRKERAGVNTAVHILLDSSGSMSGIRMELANQACFAVASALHGIRGVSLAVTAFPGTGARDGQTVAPVLRPNQAMHTLFGIRAAGGTPMDAALWWVLRQLYVLPEPRKLILLITDGVPDDPPATQKAMRVMQEFGMEIYGIGIETNALARFLSGKQHRSISGIGELAPAMFGILHNALAGGHAAN